MLTLTVLLAITGESLLTFVIWIVIAGIIYWLLTWLIDKVAIPEPFSKVAKVVIAVVAVIFLINALLGLVGKAFIAW